MTTTSDRFEIARTQYNRALDRLHEVVALDETDIIRDSMIQRFEFTYELAWKCMFYWLRDQGENGLEMQRPMLQRGQGGQRGGVHTQRGVGRV